MPGSSLLNETFFCRILELESELKAKTVEVEK